MVKLKMNQQNQIEDGKEPQKYYKNYTTNWWKK